jgi:replication factor A1
MFFLQTFRYRLEVEVRYEGHNSKFLFWDRECAELIGKTAAELKSIMIEVYTILN